MGFTLPEAANATFTVFGITGRVKHSVEGDFAAGYHEIAVDKADLNTTGVLYYRLNTLGEDNSIKFSVAKDFIPLD